MLLYKILCQNIARLLPQETQRILESWKEAEANDPKSGPFTNASGASELKEHLAGEGAQTWVLALRSNAIQHHRIVDGYPFIPQAQAEL